MNIELLLSKMSLEEKASLCSGANTWDTKTVPGVPAVTMSDGPHGLRRQVGYQNNDEKIETRKAVCFPTAAALAASFDWALLKHIGGLLGEECQNDNVQMLLGPGVNIKRSPLCGRNFEYFSEDPYLAGELAAAFVGGLQAQGVSACVKHFAINNQEYRRMSNDSRVSERAMREIYLPAFEKTVKQGKAKALMCSYNRINGTYACENTWLLTDVLRREWGFDGIVVTDWGAMHERVEALKAGLNLEMPSSNGVNDAKIIEAVRNGSLNEDVLDHSVRELLTWMQWCLDSRKAVPVSMEEHHLHAREAAAECAVLLKNELNALPLSENEQVLFVGQYAEKPRSQGGGSSHIECTVEESAVEVAQSFANVKYEQMFNDGSPCSDEAWRAALKAASVASAVVVFAGLPSTEESECFDRKHMHLPQVQEKAIRELADVQPNVIVVLHNGSPVEMPWLQNVRAVLEMYTGGQGVGWAAAQLLFGRKNPSGKLPETFPLRLEDTPCYLEYSRNKHAVQYGEGIYVGYRWYDTRKMEVLFPFGHGLSYTRFELINAKISSDQMDDESTIEVSVNVRNIGSCFGKEVVQLYVGFDGEDKVGRPMRELKGFAKISLQPGESGVVSFKLDKRSFAYYEEMIGDWYVPSGLYNIYVGASSRDLPLCCQVNYASRPLPLPPYETMTVGDLLDEAQSEDIQKQVMSLYAMALTEGLAGMSQDAIRQMMRDLIDGLPLHSIKSFANTSDDEIMRVVELVRQQM